MNRLLVLLFAMIIPIVFGGGGIWFGLAIGGKGPLLETANVIIPKGAGLEGSAAILKSANVIASEWVFMGLATATGARQKIQAGEYEFEPRMSTWRVVQKLARGDVLLRNVTIPEGMTSAQVVAVLLNNPYLSGDIPAPPPEGSLMPDTYRFTRGDARQTILDRMTRARADFTAEQWQKRNASYPLATMAEWVTLASIVEAETPKAEERPRVAGVYLNRLAKGMKLEADPTVAYGLPDLGRPLWIVDLQRDHPHNTYTRAGLPPTPINNPSRASLLAALTPEVHDLLFFVADGTGGHIFAKTFTDHQKNVMAWRRIQREAAQKEPKP